MALGVEERVDHSAVAGASIPPGPHARSVRRLILPMAIAAGWGALLSYTAIVLTQDPPMRPVPSATQANLTEPGPYENAMALSRPAAKAPLRSESQTASAESALHPVADEGQVPARLQSTMPAQAPEVAQALPTVPGLGVRRGVSDPPDSVQRVAARPQPNATVAAVSADRAEYVGVWGPTGEACGKRSRRRGFLPATITLDGARAGRTVCQFRDGRKLGNGWTVAASCNDRGRRWSSQVRLVVDGNRLTWSSAKGASSYVRCNRRDG